MAEAEGLNVAAALAELRGEMSTGFTRLEGKLNLLIESQKRTTQDVEDLDKRTDDRFRALDGRVAALEARRWPIGVIAGVSGAASAVAAGVALLVK